MVEIEIAPAEYQQYLEKTARDLKEVKINGFRPGQAPYDLVKKKLGEEKLLELALQEIIGQTLFQTIKDKNLAMVGTPEIKILKMAPQNPLIFQAIVDLLPQITLPDLKKITIKKNEVAVSDEEVLAALEELVMTRAKEVAVSRPAASGDKVEIDYNITINKVPVEGGQQKKIPVYLGKQNLIPGLDGKIIGLKSDEEKEFELDFPKDYFNKNLAGKLAEFKVKVNQIFQIEKEEVSDEFAQNVGKFANLNELKNQLSANIKGEKDHEENKKLETAIIDELIDHASFTEIPDNLLKKEANIMVEELKSNLHAYQLNFSAWLNNLKKTEKDLLNDFQPQAVRRVQAALVIREIAKKENVSVDDHEVEEEINHILGSYPGQKDIIAKVSSKGYKDYVRHNLTSKKTMHWLKEKVAI